MADDVKSDESGQRTTILRYLAATPHAADTVEGVVNWWMSRQRYIDTRDVIERILEDLVTEGYLAKTTLPDNKILYRCGLNEKFHTR